jgi:CxxC-x17-CxxC domain-containing protein
MSDDMSFGQGGSSARPPRQMVDVSSMGLSCANCGVAVTELPFMPSTDRPVTCRDCNRKSRENFGSTASAERPQRSIVDVSSMGLSCADCGVAVTELPFQPSPDRPVLCRDCNRKRRASFGSVR